MSGKNKSKWVYVTTYEVTRRYGGPEEGGWWYYNYTPVECSLVIEEEAETVKRLQHSEFEQLEYGNITSMVGGVEYVTYIEPKACYNETKEKPRYE